MEFLPIEYYGIRVYAGFWRRLGALLIDTLVYTPIIILSFFIYTTSINWIIPVLIIHTFFYFIYTIFFHYKYGATLGKLAVGIRVTQPDSSKITFKQAFLRSSIDLSFAVLLLIAELIALSNMDVSYFNSLPKEFEVRWDYVYSDMSSGYQIIQYISFIWVICETIVFLFNRRKRALHDFIAGTVVVKKDFVDNEEAL